MPLITFQVESDGDCVTCVYHSAVETAAHPHLTHAAVGAPIAGHFQEYDVYDEAGSYLGLLGSNGHYTAAASVPHEAYSQYDGYY